MQTPRGEEDLRLVLPDNPFVPPKGDICFINDLPPELLSRIFEIGTADRDSEDEEEDDIAGLRDNFRHHSAEDDDDSNMDSHNSDDEVVKESEDEEDDEWEDEEGTDDEDGSDATESSLSPPWPPFEIVVSHVCRHWRHVAFSTPSLWTTIVVGPEARPPYESVSMLLERSKGLPIDIYINCDPSESECHVDDSDHECSPPTDADLKILYSLLIPHVHRWRVIEVSVSEYHHMYVFLTAASDPSISAAPQLKTLELYYHDDMEEFDSFGYPSMSKHLTLFGGSAPSLTNVVLWGVHVDWSQPWIASASKLVDLDLAYIPEDVRPSWAQFSSILRGASVLEKLGLRMTAPLGDPPEWHVELTPGSFGDLNAPIQLPKVTDFVLAFQSPVRAVGILRKLYLPALKHMVLDFDSGDYTDFVRELAGPAVSLSSTPAQDRSRSLLSRLESLKIAGLPCRNECVEMLYGELQNLTLLNISLLYLDRIFLDILCTTCTLADRGDAWLPRLVTLYVTGTSGHDIREVVRKRRDAGAPLESVYVEESCEVDSKDEEWLQKNLKTFEFFEGSDDEGGFDIDDVYEDAWSDME